MLENILSRLKYGLLVMSIAALIVGVLGLGDSIKIFKGDIHDISTLTEADLGKGKLFEGKINAVYDIVAVEETTRTSYGVETSHSESPFYLVDVDNAYIVLYVGNKEMQAKCDDMMKFTWENMDESGALPPGSMSVTTQTKKMPEEVAGFLWEYFQESGFTEQEYRDSVVTEYYFNVVDYDSMKYFPFGLMLFGVLALAGSIIWMKKTSY